MNQSLVRQILAYLDDNIYAKISLEELSRLFYFHKDYIMRVFKKELNMTIIDYMNKKRIFASLEELKETQDSILKVALMHGFTSQEYYTETFIKVMGVNPNTYRKFTKNHPSVTEDNTNKIRKNLTDLKYQLDQITKYKQNVPKETVKQLTRYH
ncbi:MAG: helix-turn-helix transcriptional regulator [Bacilli bacterium]|nr:helix-turn-helix transcriptional regulator [Bacilli bacterium]